MRDGVRRWVGCPGLERKKSRKKKTDGRVIGVRGMVWCRVTCGLRPHVVGTRRRGSAPRPAGLRARGAVRADDGVRK
jgi:hypothetical protein